MTTLTLASVPLGNFSAAVMNFWVVASQSDQASVGTGMVSAVVRVTHGRLAETGRPVLTVTSAFSARSGQARPVYGSGIKAPPWTAFWTNALVTQLLPLIGFHGSVKRVAVVADLTWPPTWSLIRRLNGAILVVSTPAPTSALTWSLQLNGA